MCVWGCLDKYISIATWPPQTKIPSSAPAVIRHNQTWQKELEPNKLEKL